MTLILAFPAGWLVRRLGVKRLLLISGLASVTGSVLGALATEASFMLASRLVEGVGLGIIVVVGSVAVDIIMPARIRGLAMGIWICFFPAGVFISMLVAPLLSNALGWASVWWFTALLGVAVTVLILVFYVEPESNEEEPALSRSSEQPQAPQTQPALSSKPDYRSIVFVGLAHVTWNLFWAAGFLAFYPTYLQEVLLLPNTTAGLMVAIPNLIVVVLGPLAGKLTDILGNCKWLLVASLAESVILLFIAFSGALPLAWVFVLAMSLAASAFPTAVFAIIPKLAKNRETIGVAMGAVVFCAHSGILIGTAVLGTLKVALGGWQETAFFFLIPVVAVGLLFSLFIKEKT